MAVEGIFGKINARNENNRFYPREEFERNLREGSRFNKMMKSRAVIGELEHPESGNTHLARGSHVITDAWIEDLNEDRIKQIGYTTDFVQPGTYVLGRMEILDNENGKTLASYFKAEAAIGVSSRGRGDTAVESDGSEKVFDYDLETWDAVYRPSVVEAKPRKTEAENLGQLSDEGADTASTPTDVPKAPEVTATAGEPPTTQSDAATSPSWKGDAEKLIRELETTASETEPEFVKMLELQGRGLDIIDVLAAETDPEAIKLKSQAMALLKVILSRVTAIEVGKDVAGTKTSDGKKKESEESQKSNLKEKIEKPDEIAQAIKDERQKAGLTGVVSQADIKAALEKRGHDPASPENSRALSDALAKKGLKIQQTTENLFETEPDKIQDGELVSVNVNKIDRKNTGVGDNIGPVIRAADIVYEWLSKTKGDQLATVMSRGDRGYVIRFMDPTINGYDVFVPFDVTEKLNPEEDKGDSDMTKTAELLKKLSETNKLQKEELEKLKERYEGAVKLIKTTSIRAAKAETSALTERKRKEVALKMLNSKRQVRESISSKSLIPNKRRPITAGSRLLRERLRANIDSVNDKRSNVVTESESLISLTAERLTPKRK